MIDGKISEFGIITTNQLCFFFIKRRNFSFPNINSFVPYVWHIKSSGISLFTTGKTAEGKYSHCGRYCGVYSKIDTHSYQKDQNICSFLWNVYQQSRQNGAGRIFSKKRSWRKKRDKLSFLITMIGCGSKSSLRLTIFLSLKTMTYILMRLHLNN